MLSSYCKRCKKDRDALYRAGNTEKLRAYDRGRDLEPARRETQKHRLKMRYGEHKVEHLATCKRYAQEHPELVRAIKRAYAKRNPAKIMANVRERQVRKFNAVPKWANKFFIEEIYDLARRRTEVMGFEWHVDHIVPLRHPLVQGLHCEQNLQVIPAVRNYTKGNRTWPDMPGSESFSGASLVARDATATAT